jgi:hypothetical protein
MAITDQESQDVSHELADILDEAANVIEERGWAHATMETREGAVCLWRALNVATKEEERCPVAYSALMEVAKYLLAEGYFSNSLSNNGGIEALPVLWNDRPGRTKSDVVVALQKTAIGLRERS